MFGTVAFTTLLASTALLTARADVPQPNSPTPGTVFKVGGQCTMGWTADTTGTWKEMYIELNTGDNFNMVHLTTVAKVDGTNPAITTYTWTCPDVTPNSNIYFYQFSSPVSTQPSWTGRFTIASASGQTTPPTNATQPGSGAALPWGTGAYVDPTQATPPPYNSPKGSNLSGGSSAAGGSSSAAVVPASSSSAAAVVPASVASKSSSIQYVTIPTSSSSTSASTSTSKPASNTSGAFAPHVQQSFIALSLAAAGFALAL